ncbi:hypothetical protein R50073_33580 [Maricurvus nonylphenolicus]|uniref:hypothetical protein n=1 Tax=Maricurvus nonylphenolicus TaxID=1008307 RepID=UPI0036F429D2
MNKIKRFLQLTSILAALTGCASSTTTEGIDDLKNEVIGTIFKSKIKKNGQNLTCSQPSFLECVDITKNICLKEAESLKVECINYADEKQPAINSKHEAEKYFMVFAQCMSIKQVMLRPENFIEVGHCLKRSGGANPELVKQAILAP